jgi:GntR family transcriptional regulator
MAGKPRVAVEFPQDWRPVDAESPTPLYEQVLERVRSAIVEGRLAPGRRLPAGEVMCGIFGVSMNVVLHAMGALAVEGLVRRRQGQGTFVAKPKTVQAPAAPLAGVDTSLHARAAEMETVPLGCTFGVASEDVCKTLGVTPPLATVQITRLRLSEGAPRVLVSSHLPYTLGEFLLTADLAAAPLATLLKERGYAIARGRKALRAVAATPFEGRPLKVKSGAPLLLVESTTYLEDGQALEYSEAYWRTDLGGIDADLVPVHAPYTDPKAVAFMNAIVTAMEH